MNDLEKTIKHFESLQKRYTTQHNGKMCERVADALDALQLYKRLTHDFGDIIYEEILDKLTKMIAGDLVDVKPIDTSSGGSTQKFKIGQKVYQQGMFDIFKCEIVEYLPKHVEFFGQGEEMSGYHPEYVDAYKVKYEDGTTSVIPAYDLSKSTEGMYQI